MWDVLTKTSAPPQLCKQSMHTCRTEIWFKCPDISQQRVQRSSLVADALATSDFTSRYNRPSMLLQNKTSSWPPLATPYCLQQQQHRLLFVPKPTTFSRQAAMRVPSSPAASPATARSYEPLDFGEDAEEERKPYEKGRLPLIASRIWRGARPLLVRCSSSSLPCGTRPTHDAGTCAAAVSAAAPQ
jgi:hypothetical protein